MKAKIFLAFNPLRFQSDCVELCANLLTYKMTMVYLLYRQPARHYRAPKTQLHQAEKLAASSG